MSKLFNPAVALMYRLKYPQKFALISLLFALPLALTLVLFISERNLSINTAHHELQGTAYLRPLRTMLQDMIEDRLLVEDIRAGQAARQADLTRQTGLIDADLQVVL